MLTLNIINDMTLLQYVLVLTGIYLLYALFKERLENVTSDTPELRQYVAERVVKLMKENPNISFTTFSNIMRDNNNHHKNLESSENFTKLKELGGNIQTNDVLDIL